MTATTVWAMEDGGAVVKTTDGPDAAKTAYKEWLTRQADSAPWADWSVNAEDIPAHVEGMTYRERWFRWTPCNPRSCYAGTQHRPGHLTYLDAPGRGVWRGVLVDY